MGELSHVVEGDRARLVDGRGRNRVPSVNVIGANDRIGVAVVGVTWCCHGVGMNHLAGIHEKSKENNTRVVAACDPFRKYRRFAAQKAALTESQLYTDYRRLLERSDVDAVLISTPETLHARIALEALEAGKHVYCERPFTRYLGEAFRVWDKVRSTGKTFQYGAQCCSAGALPWCAELVRKGTIGTPVWSQAYYCRNSVGGEWNYMLDPEATADNVDWAEWLGPDLPGLPFSTEDFCRSPKYYRYSAGLLGILAPSRLAALMVASGATEFPSRVNCVSTRNVHSDRAVPGQPDRDVPERVQLAAEFPSGHVITIGCSSVNAKSPGITIHGHKATVNLGTSGDWAELVPEEEFAEEIQPRKVSGLPPEDIHLHEKNWFDCIRSGARPNADIELAVRSQTVLSLAEMSDRLKVTCLFDEKTRRITDGNGKEIEPLTYRS